MRLHDHALVLKTNVSGTELAVDYLESAQTYHAVVTAYTAEGRIVSTLKGVITTSEFIKAALAFPEIIPSYFACVAYSTVIFNMPLGYSSTQAQMWKSSKALMETILKKLAASCCRCNYPVHAVYPNKF